MGLLYVSIDEIEYKKYDIYFTTDNREVTKNERWVNMQQSYTSRL